MRKILFFTILVLLGVQLKAQNADNNEQVKAINQQSIYDFIVNDIYGEDFNFESLKGKKIMIVNTASECGLTGQYEELQALYNQFKDEDFIIIGFPANNFKGQEPGTNQEIVTFCKDNFGVSFPMMSKISVKGEDIHPLYKYLTSKSLNGITDSEVFWNFQKYFINRSGELSLIVKPQHSPMSDQILEWIANN